MQRPNEMAPMKKSPKKDPKKSKEETFPMEEIEFFQSSNFKISEEIQKAILASHLEPKRKLINPRTNSPEIQKNKSNTGKENEFFITKLKESLIKYTVEKNKKEKKDGKFNENHIFDCPNDQKIENEKEQRNTEGISLEKKENSIQIESNKKDHFLEKSEIENSQKRIENWFLGFRMNNFGRINPEHAIGSNEASMPSEKPKNLRESCTPMIPDSLCEPDDGKFSKQIKDSKLIIESNITETKINEKIEIKRPSLLQTSKLYKNSEKLLISDSPLLQISLENHENISKLLNEKKNDENSPNPALASSLMDFVAEPNSLEKESEASSFDQEPSFEPKSSLEQLSPSEISPKHIGSLKNIRASKDCLPNEDAPCKIHEETQSLDQLKTREDVGKALLKVKESTRNFSGLNYPKKGKKQKNSINSEESKNEAINFYVGSLDSNKKEFISEVENQEKTEAKIKEKKPKKKAIDSDAQMTAIFNRICERVNQREEFKNNFKEKWEALESNESKSGKNHQIASKSPNQNKAKGEYSAKEKLKGMTKNYKMAKAKSSEGFSELLLRKNSIEKPKKLYIYNDQSKNKKNQGKSKDEIKEIAAEKSLVISGLRKGTEKKEENQKIDEKSFYKSLTKNDGHFRDKGKMKKALNEEDSSQIIVTKNTGESSLENPQETRAVLSPKKDQNQLQNSQKPSKRDLEYSDSINKPKPEESQSEKKVFHARKCIGMDSEKDLELKTGIQKKGKWWQGKLTPRNLHGKEAMTPESDAKYKRKRSPMVYGFELVDE